MRALAVRCNAVTDDELTLDQVRAWATDRGEVVSPRQLKAWWNADLLPRPRTPGRGRGRGRAVLLPSGMLPQLEALLRHRGRTKAPHELRCLLWLDGFPIPWDVVRRDLCESLRGEFPGASERSKDAIAAKARALKRRRSTSSRLKGISTDELSAALDSLVSAADSGDFPYLLTDAIDAEPTGYDHGGRTIGDVIGSIAMLSEEDIRLLPATLSVPEEMQLLRVATMRDAICTAEEIEGSLARELLQSMRSRPEVEAIMKFRHISEVAALVATMVLGFRNPEAVARLGEIGSP